MTSSCITQDITRLDTEIKDALACSHACDTHRWKLEKQRKKLITELVFESGMLQKLEFQVKVYNGKISLVSNNEFNKLTNDEKSMFKDSMGFPYHFTFELTKYVKLGNNDDVLSIRFDDNKRVNPFIKKHKLHVFTDNVDAQLKTMEDDIVSEQLAMEDIKKLRDELRLIV